MFGGNNGLFYSRQREIEELQGGQRMLKSEGRVFAPTITQTALHWTQTDKSRLAAVRASSLAGYNKWRSNPVAGAARNAAIVAMRDGGSTLRECGQHFGLSGERVRGICLRDAAKREDGGL